LGIIEEEEDTNKAQEIIDISTEPLLETGNVDNEIKDEPNLENEAFNELDGVAEVSKPVEISVEGLIMQDIQEIMLIIKNNP